MYSNICLFSLTYSFIGWPSVVFTITLIFLRFSLLRQLYLPVYIRKTYAVPSIPFFVTFPCLVIISDRRTAFVRTENLHVASCRIPAGLQKSAHGNDVIVQYLLLYCCVRYMILSNKRHAKHGMAVF